MKPRLAELDSVEHFVVLAVHMQLLCTFVDAYDVY